MPAFVHIAACPQWGQFYRHAKSGVEVRVEVVGAPMRSWSLAAVAEEDILANMVAEEVALASKIP